MVSAQRVPAGPLRGGERGVDLITHRGCGPLARPPVRHELDDPQRLPGCEFAAHRHPGKVGLGVDLADGPGRSVDDVVHRNRDTQATRTRSVSERSFEVVTDVVFGNQRRDQRGGRAWVVGLRRHRLVRNER